MNFVAQGGDLRIPAQATIEWVRVEHHLVLRSTPVGSCQYATSCIPKDSGVVLEHLYIRVVRMLAATKKSRPEYNGSLEYGQIEYPCSATHVSRPGEDFRGRIRRVSSDSFPKKSVVAAAGPPGGPSGVNTTTTSYRVVHRSERCFTTRSQPELFSPSLSLPN